MPDLSAYPAIDLTTGEDIEESVTADLTKYSPDQERDERGRFGSGNGDGSARHRDTRDSVGAGRILSYKETEAFEHGSAAPFIISDGKGGYRFSAERAALHEQIIQSRLAGIPKSDNPEYHMLGGGPASGKSTMLESGKVEVPATTEAVHIDVDSIKAELPEYDPKNPGFVHEESSYLGKEVQARAFEASQSVVLDGTGNNSVQSVEGKIDTARAYGYRVIANYATVPTSLAVQRDASRSRSVGETRVRDIHASVSQVFPGVAAKFDSVNLWDNSGKVPQLIATGGSGSLRVVDQAAYQAFLDKAGK
jgi:predicted ABC-type ATPase